MEIRETPFVLIARVMVKSGKVRIYEDRIYCG